MLSKGIQEDFDRGYLSRVLKEAREQAMQIPGHGDTREERVNA